MAKKSKLSLDCDSANAMNQVRHVSRNFFASPKTLFM